MDKIDKLENKICVLEERIVKIELLLKEKKIDNKVKTHNDIPTDILKRIIAKLDELNLLPLVLLTLRFAGDISKEEQIKILKKWGKKESESLRGGNYNRDILNTGLVHKVGKSGKAIIYGLTEKGKIEAENILRKL